MRQWLDELGIQYGPAFTGLAAACTAEGAVDTVLAEVALPRSIRSQQDAYGVHPALLDACFQSVAAHPDAQRAANGGLLLPLGVRRLRAYSSTRNAHYCYTRMTRADATGVEADLDVFDEHGTVLLTVRGLQLGTGVSETGDRDRLLGERLLTIEWQQRDLPEAGAAAPGAWLLVSTSPTADVVASKLTDALKLLGAKCTTMTWPQKADHRANAERLSRQLAAGDSTGVVVLTGPKNGNPDDLCGYRGRDYVRAPGAHRPRAAGNPGRTASLVCRDQECPERLWPPTDPTWSRAGCADLIRVIGTEHPHLRATQIDLDEATDAEQLARQLLGGSEEDETAWRNGQWYTARLYPTPLRPEERRTTVVNHERDGMRLQIRTPGDLESMELAAYERIPPGPGEIEVAVSASSINFADVLVAFGRYPSFEGHLPQTRHRLRRCGDRGRTRRHRLTRSVTTSAAYPPTAAGARSSPATRG